MISETHPQQANSVCYIQPDPFSAINENLNKIDENKIWQLSMMMLIQAMPIEARNGVKNGLSRQRNESEERKKNARMSDGGWTHRDSYSRISSLSYGFDPRR